MVDVDVNHDGHENVIQTLLCGTENMHFFLPFFCEKFQQFWLIFFLQNLPSLCHKAKKQPRMREKQAENKGEQAVPDKHG